MAYLCVEREILSVQVDVDGVDGDHFNSALLVNK